MFGVLISNHKQAIALQQLMEQLYSRQAKRKDNSYEYHAIYGLSTAEWDEHFQEQALDKLSITNLIHVWEGPYISKHKNFEMRPLSDRQMIKYGAKLVPYLADLETKAGDTGDDQTAANYRYTRLYVLHVVNSLRKETKKRRGLEEHYINPSMNLQLRDLPDDCVTILPQEGVETKQSGSVAPEPMQDKSNTTDTSVRLEPVTSGGLTIDDDKYLESVHGMGFFGSKPSPA